MEEDEEHQDDRTDALEEVSQVLAVPVVADVRLAGHHDPDPVYGVEEDRQVDERPLNGWQQRQTVNLVDLLLVDGWAAVVTGAFDEGGVDQQVNDEVPAEENACERVES